MAWPAFRQLACLAAAAAAAAMPALGQAPALPAQAEAELTAALERIDRLWFGQRSQATVTMIVKTTRYTRELRLTYWVDGRDKTLIRIDAPPRERGNATLKVGNDIYNYLPKIGRTVKVSPALRAGAWMGSHFTNDDLLRATRFSDDYDAKLTSRKGTGAAEIWTIELTPKAGTAVPWSRVAMTLERATAIPSSQLFYDDKGALARTVTFTDVKDLGGRRAPERARVTPAGKLDEMTELRYLAVDRDVTFSDGFFSLANLKNQ